MLARNGRAAVLLTATDPRSLPSPPWPGVVGWCLIDCDDVTRRSRLEARGWDAPAVSEALLDAHDLRAQIECVDTSATTPREAAARVATLLEAGQDGLRGLLRGPGRDVRPTTRG